MSRSLLLCVKFLHKEHISYDFWRPMSANRRSLCDSSIDISSAVSGKNFREGNMEQTGGSRASLSL